MTWLLLNQHNECDLALRVDDVSRLVGVENGTRVMLSNGDSYYVLETVEEILWEMGVEAPTDDDEDDFGAD